MGGSLLLTALQATSAPPHSVFHTHTDHDKHRVALFRAAVDGKYRVAERNGQRRPLCGGR
jgi:hypothetical protein